MADTLVELPSSPPARFEQMKSMSLLEHLEELRRRLIYSVLAIMAAFFVCWNYADRIFRYMQAPIMPALRAHKMEETLIYTNPIDPFNLYLKIGLIAGIFLASPFVLYQVWLFISPGLYRHEKRYVVPFMCSTVGLFLAGGYFGYKVIFPVALDFLIHSYGGAFKASITIDAYTKLFLTIILGLAIIFEMPIVLGFAGMMGVVNAKFLFKTIRGAVLVCVTMAAILSPTTDIMNLTIYAAPMVILYIGSIGLVWLVHPRQRRKRAEKRKEKDREDGRSL